MASKYSVSGMSTSDIKALQTALNNSGANLKVDGAWGSKSQAALDKAYGSGSDPYSVYNGGGNNTYASSASATYNPYSPSGRSDTSFSSRYSLANNRGAGSATGIFDLAPGRQYGDLQHISGYTGKGYQDQTGRSYTDYGSLLRTDGFYYPEGARVSQNGMYFDAGDGKGWQHAKYASLSNGMKKPSEAYGYAPGSTTPTMDSFNEMFEEMAKNGGNTSQGKVIGSDTTPDNSITTDTSTGSENTAGMTDEELKRYWAALLGG